MDPDIEFVSEAEDLLETVRSDLEILSERGSAESGGGELLNRLFRSLHSLKGLSAAAGLQKVDRLAHQLESLLDGLRMGRLQVDDHLLDTLSESLGLMDGLVRQRPNAASRYADVMKVLENSLQRCSGTSSVPALSSTDLDPDLVKSLTAFEVHRLQSCIDLGRNVFLISCFFPLNSVHAALPEFEHMLRNHGELVATVPGTLEAGDLMDFSLLYIGSLPEDLGKHAPAGNRLRVRAVLSRRVERSEPERAPSPPSQVIRVDSDSFDELLEISKNLVLEYGQLKRFYQQAATGKMPESKGLVERSFQEMERGLLRLQRSLTDARMVPVRFLFQRMTRVVRTSEKRCGKQIELVMQGSEVPLDRGMLEQLHEPLLHLVRNAVDHGIETPEERTAAGKSAKGSIVLEACRRSGHVTIEVRDDGRGIDTESVRARGCALGYIREGDELSERQLYELLFQPGFSTRKGATELSGRGVGMDVVRCQLESLCGLVEIDSWPAIGTRMTLTLPVQKTIMPVLVVTVADRLYALALEGVRYVKSLESNKDDLAASGQEADTETPLPLYDLRSHLHGDGDSDKRSGYLVVVGLGDRQAGFVVDGLHGRRESVIRPFDALLRQVPGISGVAELIDAGYVLLLDLGYMIREAGQLPQGRNGNLFNVSRSEPALSHGVDEQVAQSKGCSDSGGGTGLPDVAGDMSGIGHACNFISFFLDDLEYALDILEVVEIIERAKWITVPNAPVGVRGIILWRDQVVPVLDTGMLMGTAECSATCCGTVIVCISGNRKAAMVVDRVGELFRSAQESEADVQVASSYDSRECFSRFIQRGRGRIGVLNLAAMLDFSVTELD